jgi:hypothetical protein
VCYKLKMELDFLTMIEIDTICKKRVFYKEVRPG